MRLLDKAPTDNTKIRHIRQSPNRQHNPPKDNTKPRSPAISNAPARYGGRPRPGMGVTLAWYGGHTGMGVTPDWYGGRPGLVWGSPRPGMGVTPDRYGGRPGPVWGSPRTGMGVTPDRYGGHPGPVWGPGIGPRPHGGGACAGVQHEARHALREDDEGLV